MEMKTIAGVAVILGLIAPCAIAAPSFNSYWSESNFFIDATNNETRSYGCSVTYQFEYSDSGTRRAQANSGAFTVQAATRQGDSVKPWSGNVLKLTGSWDSPSKVGEPNIQCN